MTDAGICVSSYIELPQAGVQSDDAGGRDDNDDIEHEIVQKGNFLFTNKLLTRSPQFTKA